MSASSSPITSAGGTRRPGRPFVHATRTNVEAWQVAPDRRDQPGDPSAG
jgi:hypothetical protein